MNKKLILYIVIVEIEKIQGYEHLWILGDNFMAKLGSEHSEEKQKGKCEQEEEESLSNFQFL